MKNREETRKGKHYGVRWAKRVEVSELMNKVFGVEHRKTTYKTKIVSSKELICTLDAIVIHFFSNSMFKPNLKFAYYDELSRFTVRLLEDSVLTFSIL